MWQKFLLAVIDTLIQSESGLRSYYTEYQLDLLRHATSTPLSILFLTLNKLEQSSSKEMKLLIAQAVNSAEMLEKTVRLLNNKQHTQEKVNVTKLLTTVCAWSSRDGCKVELHVYPSRRAVFLYNLNETRFHEALFCIINNAVEASRKAPVVSVVLIEVTDAVLIQVKDFGLGMTFWQQLTAWLPYISFKPGNHGIGLFFCKRVISELGGTIAVHSTPQLGTYFECRIPTHR